MLSELYFWDKYSLALFSNHLFVRAMRARSCAEVVNRIEGATKYWYSPHWALANAGDVTREDYMTLSIWIPWTEDSSITPRDFSASFEWRQPKSANRRQARTACRHRIFHVRRAFGWQNRSTPPECIPLGCVLSNISVPMDLGGLPRQRGASEWRMFRESMSAWNRCGNPVNSTGQPEHFAAGNQRDLVDFVGSSSHPSGQDWRCPESFTVDLPHSDEWIQTNPFDDVHAVTSQDSCRCTQ
jgi:hypothetical protein